MYLLVLELGGLYFGRRVVVVTGRHRLLLPATTAWLLWEGNRRLWAEAFIVVVVTGRHRLLLPATTAWLLWEGNRR